MNYFAFELTGLPALLAILLLLYVFVYIPIKLITMLIARAKRKADHIRLLKQKTIIAEYEPPANLTPAEMGYVFDTKLSIAEVYATIIQLEQEGIVSIARSDEGEKITSVVVAPSETKNFEKYVIGQLSEHEGKIITKRLLKSICINGSGVMNRALEEQGYFVPRNQQIKAALLRLLFIMALLVAAFPFLAFRPSSVNDITAASFFVIIFSPVYFFASVFLYIAYQKIAGEPWLGSKKLKKVWTDIEGYRHYIQVVELDNLTFDSEQTKVAVKNKTLPYAIALELEKGWQQRVR